MLAVLAHPMASTLAERTGQAVGNISHHLKVLGTAGLIEEAPELARDRRERWWRYTAGPLRWSTRDFAGDAASGVASEAVARAAQLVNLDAQLAQLRAWAEAPEERKARWLEGPLSMDSWMGRSRSAPCCSA